MPEGYSSRCPVIMYTHTDTHVPLSTLLVKFSIPNHMDTHVIYNRDTNTHMNSQSVYCQLLGTVDVRGWPFFHCLGGEPLPSHSSKSLVLT